MKLNIMGGKNMKYEVVYLSEKVVAGLSARTKNTAPDMQAVIGSLWGKFYGEGMIEKINDKVNGYAIGLYDQYESDASGYYDATVGTEVKGSTNQTENIVLKKIPAGKYAKFEVEGQIPMIISAFWEKLWAMDLDRSYLADFEEYIASDGNTGKVNIYIGIK